MATSMSTPIAQLPPSAAPPGNVRHDEDKVVADVINEMNAMGASSPAHAPPPPQVLQPHVVQQYNLPTHLPSHGVNVNTAYANATAGKLFGIVDKTIMQRALISALAALILFYPESFSALYAKVGVVSISAALDKNDRIVRAILLAVFLYVVMWKLNI
jgi:hypothetical protein